MTFKSIVSNYFSKTIYVIRRFVLCLRSGHTGHMLLHIKYIVKISSDIQSSVVWTSKLSTYVTNTSFKENCNEIFPIGQNEHILAPICFCTKISMLCMDRVENIFSWKRSTYDTNYYAFESNNAVLFQNINKDYPIGFSVVMLFRNISFRVYW